MFVQECYKTSHGVNGYKSEAIRELRGAFKKLKDKGHTLVFENLVDSLLEDGKKPTKKMIEEHKDVFIRTFNRVNPDFVIPLGAAVTGTFTNRGKFSDLVGRKIDVSGGFSLIPMYHPDYASKSKQRQREYSTQMKIVLNQIMGGPNNGEKCNYKLYITKNGIVKRLKQLMQMTDCVQAFDWETSHLIPEKGEVVCLSISHKERQGDCFYFFKNMNTEVRVAIRRWLGSPVPKVAHNAKFEIKWAMRHFKIEPVNIVGCTQQMHHILDEEMSHQLSDLAYIYTDMGGYDLPMVDFLNSGKKHHEADPEFMLPYSAGDSDCCLRLYNVFHLMIDANRGFQWLEQNIVLPAIHTLARVEERGMKIDYKQLDVVEERTQNEIEKIQKRINGYPESRATLRYFQRTKPRLKLEQINLGSTDQMCHLLYKECKLPVLKSSKKTRKPSTDKNILEQLKDKHKVVKSIVEMRRLEHQLIEIDEIRAKRSADDTVFSDLIQHYVVTGRLSSRNPNLQNMTGDSDVKQCFISRFKRGLLLQADFDQLELRLITSETMDENYVTAFEEGLDPHTFTAAQIYEKTMERVNKKERDKAKRVNFGVVYGITEHGLSEQLNIPVDEARDLLRKYWYKYRRVKKWMNKNVREARENLEVYSKLGRRKQIPDIHDSRWWVKESAERIASNFKIQSLGGDSTMWSFTNVDQELIKAGLDSMVVLQIHDSIIIDAKRGEVKQIIKILKDVMVDRAMRTFRFLRIPLSISVEAGQRWSELKKLAI